MLKIQINGVYIVGEFAYLLLLSSSSSWAMPILDMFHLLEEYIDPTIWTSHTPSSTWFILQLV
jgi:hypothetical protein